MSVCVCGCGRWQVGFSGSSEVQWEHGCVSMWTCNLNTLKYGCVRMPGRETRNQTNKKRRNLGPIQTDPHSDWGQGQEPIQPALRHRDKGPITLLQPRPLWTWSWRTMWRRGWGLGWCSEGSQRVYYTWEISEWRKTLTEKVSFPALLYGPQLQPFPLLIWSSENLINALHYTSVSFKLCPLHAFPRRRKEYGSRSSS